MCPELMCVYTRTRQRARKYGLEKKLRAVEYDGNMMGTCTRGRQREETAFFVLRKSVSAGLST